VETAPDMLLILQVTFTDASMTVEVANAFSGSISLWAIPEPRAGGRLRLNAFCGLNLASHALGLAGREFGWLFASPTSAEAGCQLLELIGGKRQSARLEPRQASGESRRGQDIAAALSGKRIGRIGTAPTGFDTCAYDLGRLREFAGIEIDEIELPELFGLAERAGPAQIEALRAETGASVSGMDGVDQAQLDRSFALKIALDGMRRDRALDAFAIRCWPEMFTEYGGAVCGPVSMMGEARVPCACEADVYGALTQLLLQEASGGAVFLTDLVDVDVVDNTIVAWHCGQAPLSMSATGNASAQIHSNRRMPLLLEFALRPGRVTLVRVSQAHGTHSVAIATGEVLERPRSFTGTSGVIRMDTPAGEFCRRLIGSGLEHHLALAYGDHAPAIEAAASALGLPVLEL
jgi:L-fucose isomerase-like protein